MTSRLLAAVSSLAALCLPLACGAQSKYPKPAATVSVRDLSIPEKARKNFNEGTRLLTLKDWAGSVSRFQQAINAFPTFYEAYYRMGIADTELQRETAAESLFHQSIERSNGRYAPPYFALALLLCDERQDCADAESLARTGLDLDPQNAAGHYALAWILYLTNRLPDAEQSIRETLLFQPDLEAAHRLLTQIHLRQSTPSASVQSQDAAFE